MEELVATDNADDEYMTVDADIWSEHDNAYENRDILGLDLRGKEDSRGCASGHGSKGEKKKELKKEKVATQRPLRNPNIAQPHIQTLPNRYITIRWPTMNPNRGLGMKEPPQLVFLKRTTACLVLLCVLLLGVLLGLSFYYNKLSEKAKTLLEQNNKLEEKIGALLNLTGSMYHVSSTKNNFCSTGEDLYILKNHGVLERQMSSFCLGRRIMEHGSCWIPFYWNCTMYY